MRPPDQRHRGRQRPIPPRTTPLPPSDTVSNPEQVSETEPIVAPTAPPVDSETVTRISAAEQLRHRVGACEQPVLLTGTRLLVEADTGRVLDQFDTGVGHRVGVRCRNRRAVICPSCSALYKLDAFHVFAAGLRGGKHIPTQVAQHPRLFATLTAPSFGRVHAGPGRAGSPRRCHPRHGCGSRHVTGDPAIGTALDPAGYDYRGQVLFNAHAGVLWARFTIDVRRQLATAAGLSRAEAARQVRVVFAKVAEFQTRGVVHVHAIVRLDGPHGPGSAPPPWATARRLETAIRHATRTVRVPTPASRNTAARILRWGRQVDIRRITTGDGDLSETVVARYVAKYATKSTEAAGIDVKPLHCRACVGAGASATVTATGVRHGLCRTCGGTGRRRGVTLDRLNPHVRALVDACWRLGARPEYADLRLRRWAHQLGYHGHFATKSRTYSTTFAALRAERRDWTTSQHTQPAGSDADTSVLVMADWRYTHRPDITTVGRSR